MLAQQPLTRPARSSIETGFVPVLSKIDLGDAFYQFFVAQPRPNTVAPWPPERGAWRFFHAPFLTFENRRSVYFFQAVSELLYIALCVFEIPAYGYGDVSSSSAHRSSPRCTTPSRSTS